LENTEEGHVVAAASKSMHRARRLQKKLNIPQAYGGYDEMIEREKLDAVYIANTHAEHAAAAKLCLNRGLPVLVEKAFARNAQEAEEVIALAREKKLFCMMPWNRMMNPKLAGGALLDLGVYPIAYARMIFGRAPEKVSSRAKRTWTGVDAAEEITFEYPGGKRAEMSVSFRKAGSRDAVISGTAGAIRVPHFSRTNQVVLIRNGKEECVECGANGFEHEIREVHRCLREGLTESPLMPLDETLETMRIMDTLRSQWGMKYPGE
jgi:predicted dehydrogenase